MSFYGTVTGADTYFANELTGKWSAYSSAQKTAALTQATKQIDRLPLRGQKYQCSPTQMLMFPRVEIDMYGETIYMDYDFDGATVSVPDDVVEACYVQAKALLDNHVGGDEIADLQRRGVTSISTGGTSMSFDAARFVFDQKTGLCQEASQILRKYSLVGM